MAMCQAGNRLRLTDYGELNGFVSKRTFSGKSPARRIAAKRHTSSTALRDCPRTWVSRKRETCVKPRAVGNNLKQNKNEKNFILNINDFNIKFINRTRNSSTEINTKRS